MEKREGFGYVKYYTFMEVFFHIFLVRTFYGSGNRLKFNEYVSVAEFGLVFACNSLSSFFIPFKVLSAKIWDDALPASSEACKVMVSPIEETAWKNAKVSGM